jgi:hypothetical protein
MIFNVELAVPRRSFMESFFALPFGLAALVRRASPSSGVVKVVAGRTDLTM